MPRRTTGKTSKVTTTVGSKKTASTAVSSTRTKSIYGHGKKAKPRLAKKGSVKTTRVDKKAAPPVGARAESGETAGTTKTDTVALPQPRRVANQSDKKTKLARPKRAAGNSSDGSSSSSSSTNGSEKKKRAKQKKQGRSLDVSSPGSESTSSSAAMDWPPVAPATPASYEVQLASSDTTSSDGMSSVEKDDLGEDAGDGHCSSSSSSLTGGTTKRTVSGTPMVPDEEGTADNIVLDEQDGACRETDAATAESMPDSSISEGGDDGENVACHEYGTMEHGGQESHGSGSEDNIDVERRIAEFGGDMSHSTSSEDEPPEVERLSDGADSCNMKSQAVKEDPRHDFDEQRFQELDTADAEERRRQREIENQQKLQHLRHLISYSEVLRAQFDMRIEELKETIDELNAELMVQEGVTTANRQRRFRAGYKFSPSEADAIVQDMAKRSMLANSSFVAAATFPPYYTGNMQGMIGDGELERQQELRDGHVQHIHKRNYPGMIKRLVNAYAGRPNLRGRSSTESHRLLRQKLKTVLDGNFDMEATWN